MPGKRVSVGESLYGRRKISGTEARVQEPFIGKSLHRQSLATGLSLHSSMSESIS
jgi:hypothetical protein